MKTIKRVEYDLKAHNVATIEKILEFYKTENKCCAIQATGTGKTFLILRLLEIYNDEGKVAVIFAPNNEIIKQTKKRMKKFGLNNAVFYTYQKLARMTDEEISTMEFDLIVCDELHRTGAKTWGQKFEVLVNSHPDSKVFGVTATPLRCADGRDMAEEYFDGNKACDISLAEALVREIIPVMPLYVSALYTFEEEYQNMSEKIEKANNSMEEKMELQKELLAAKQQLEKANGVPEIIKKYITNYNGKYIVFCKDKKHLYAMKDVVVGWFREAGYDGKIFEYPYYSCSSAVKKNLENFENNKEDGLKLLFVIDKLNEGLHLEDVHGCILIRPTGSNIIYYQQIGRAIDAGSTEQRVILDLVSNFNSLESFNFKKELEEKTRERRSGKFSDCSKEFEMSKFDVLDCVQECVDVFHTIESQICQAFKLWEEYEIDILKNNYMTLGKKVTELLPHRTETMIMAKANELGLIRQIPWSDDEKNILIKNFSSMGGKIVDLLPNRSIEQIRRYAFILGLHVDVDEKWCDEDINKLKDNFKEKGSGCYTMFKDKTRGQVAHMAKKLGLERSNIYKPYTKEEDRILLEHFESIGYNGVMKMLPNRTRASIQKRTRKLGLCYDVSDHRNSNYKYVYYNKRTDRYSVIITIDGKKLNFGTYISEDEAGKVAIEKAREYGKAV